MYLLQALNEGLLPLTQKLWLRNFRGLFPWVHPLFLALKSFSIPWKEDVETKDIKEDSTFPKPHS